MKLQEIPVSENNTLGNFIHYCPGCEQLHMINTVVRNEKNAIWVFINRNMERPTFSPSINIDLGNGKRCHYFLKSGVLVYCSDSTHAYAGMETELPEIPENFL